VIAIYAGAGGEDHESQFGRPADGEGDPSGRSAVVHDATVEFFDAIYQNLEDLGAFAKVFNFCIHANPTFKASVSTIKIEYSLAIRVRAQAMGEYAIANPQRRSLNAPINTEATPPKAR
jgi:hypothetical protein